MSVFSRLTDIINANLNAMLDRAEDPEKMVRLIIQEMEETLVEVRTTSARAIADKKELSRRQASLRDEAKDWERKAELAVRKERDDLARAALAERNKAAEAAEAVATELGLLDETLARLGDDIAALLAKIKDAKARRSAITLRGQAAQTRLQVRRQLADHDINDAMERFDMYERRMDDLEGRAEAYELGQKTLSQEIEGLEDAERLDAELRQLKQRVGAPAGAVGGNTPGVGAAPGGEMAK